MSYNFSCAREITATCNSISTSLYYYLINKWTSNQLHVLKSSRPWHLSNLKYISRIMAKFDTRFSFFFEVCSHLLVKPKCFFGTGKHIFGPIDFNYSFYKNTQKMHITCIFFPLTTISSCYFLGSFQDVNLAIQKGSSNHTREVNRGILPAERLNRHSHT